MAIDYSKLSPEAKKAFKQGNEIDLQRKKKSVDDLKEDIKSEEFGRKMWGNKPSNFYSGDKELAKKKNKLKEEEYEYAKQYVRGRHEEHR